LYVSQDPTEAAARSSTTAQRPVYIAIDPYAPPDVYCAIVSTFITIMMTIYLDCTAATATAWATVYASITSVRTAASLTDYKVRTNRNMRSQHSPSPFLSFLLVSLASTRAVSCPADSIKAFQAALASALHTQHLQPVARVRSLGAKPTLPRLSQSVAHASCMALSTPRSYVHPEATIQFCAGTGAPRLQRPRRRHLQPQLLRRLGTSHIALHHRHHGRVHPLCHLHTLQRMSMMAAQHMLLP